MFLKILKWLFFLLSSALVCVAIVAYLYIDKMQADLPDIKQLHNVEYQTPLSVYSADGLLLAKFGEKKRTPISIETVPKALINAFVAAEDASFFSHPGVDIKGLSRAAIQLLLTGKKKQGGSTITMQVTRNFLLSKEKTYKRKFKEIFLALQIEKEYSKNEILELYINKIYLGHRSYGIAAAASTYYAKKLSELDLSQLAMIAGLPKAPSAFNPISNPKRALLRRNYVLRRMRELDYISQADFDIASNKPISALIHSNQLEASAPYIAEMVRKQIFEQFEDDAYTLGLKVYTTIDSKLQSAATNAVRASLHSYDHRHGYRSLPHKNKQTFDSSEFSIEADTQSAQVLKINQDTASAKLKDGSIIELPFEGIKWARPFKTRNYLGPNLKSIFDILNPNDLIRVRQLPNNKWELAQIPEPDAAFVALNSSDGAILALSGGFNFFKNKYNRATQSKRQPGSGFKPIIYTTALENGFTAASVINDAPIIVGDPSQGTEWRPENYSKKFFGMTPLRVALRKSRNLISIRLLRDIGIKKVINTAKRFGFSEEQLPNTLSLALGSGYASPIQMATVFSVFANGGFLIEPYFLERIEDHKGKILFQASPKIACPQCDNTTVKRSEYAPRVISPQVNFLMNSLLRDVVQRGTATKAKVLARTDLAGKTGTTNDQKDAWFNGFSSGIAATAWLGFDTAKPLGQKETGGKGALPIWIDFMRIALKNKPEQPLVKPQGIIKAFVSPKTGLLAQSGQNGYWEFFRRRYAPTELSPVEIAFENKQEAEEDSLF